jgi:DNA-binding CsgD family transcriptional regulator
MMDDDDTQEYAHQRQWVNLTDKELEDLMAIYSGVTLYRAIENKLREKNT